MPRCSGCKTDHPATDFHRDASRSTGLSSSCRTHNNNRYHKLTPDQRNARNRLFRSRCRSKSVEALGGKCEACGWSGPHVGFDIHHRDGGGERQREELGYGAYHKYIYEHIDEFELLCALCHRLHHGS